MLNTVYLCGVTVIEFGSGYGVEMAITFLHFMCTLYYVIDHFSMCHVV